MTLADVKKALDNFSSDELRELREYIVEREEVAEVESGIDITALLEALKALREGITPEEFSEIERAMNEEYIEPVDLDE